MIRTLVALAFLVLMSLIAALVAFPWTFLSGRVDFLYRFALWTVRAAVRLAGIRVEVTGRERLDPSATCIYMSNHASNADPPILIPLIPRRTSVLVKKELFRVPILSRAMRMASLVEVDRRDRDAAIASVGRAAEVLRQGINMTVFPEGTRSPDSRLLPFKKGPFHLALETGAAIVPVTMVGTHELLPKGKWRVKPGVVTVIFHPPVAPQTFRDRDALMAAVREQIASALPEGLGSRN